MFTLGDVADILDSALDTGISIVDTLAKLSDMADEGNVDREICLERLDLDETLDTNDNVIGYHIASKQRSQLNCVDEAGNGLENIKEVIPAPTINDYHIKKQNFNNINCDTDTSNSGTDFSKDNKQYSSQTTTRQGTYESDTSSTKTLNDAARQGIPIIEALDNLCSVADNFVKDYNVASIDNISGDNCDAIASKKNQEIELEFVINDRVNKMLESFRNLDSTVNQIKQNALRKCFREVKGNKNVEETACFRINHTKENSQPSDALAHTTVIHRNKKRSPRPQTIISESHHGNRFEHANTDGLLMQSIPYNEDLLYDQSRINPSMDNNGCSPRKIQQHGKLSRGTYVLVTADKANDTKPSKVNPVNAKDIMSESFEEKHRGSEGIFIDKNVVSEISLLSHDNSKEKIDLDDTDNISLCENTQLDDNLFSTYGQIDVDTSSQNQNNDFTARPNFERSLSNIENSLYTDFISRNNCNFLETRISGLSMSLPDLRDRQQMYGVEPVGHIMSKLGLLNEIMSASLSKLTELHNVERSIHLSSDSTNLSEISTDSSLHFSQFHVNSSLVKNKVRYLSASVPINTTENLSTLDDAEVRSSSAPVAVTEDFLSEGQTPYRSISACSGATYTLSPTLDNIGGDIPFDDSDKGYSVNLSASSQTQWRQLDTQLSDVDNIIHKLENQWSSEIAQFHSRRNLSREGSFSIQNELPIATHLNLNKSGVVILRENSQQKKTLITGTHVHRNSDSPHIDTVLYNDANATPTKNVEERNDNRSTYVLNVGNSLSSKQGMIYEFDVYDDIAAETQEKQENAQSRLSQSNTKNSIGHRVKNTKKTFNKSDSSTIYKHTSNTNNTSLIDQVMTKYKPMRSKLKPSESMKKKDNATRSTYILLHSETKVINNKKLKKTGQKNNKKNSLQSDARKLHPVTRSKYKMFLKRTSIGYNSKESPSKEEDEPLTARLAALRMQLEEKRRQFEEEKKKRQDLWNEERSKMLQDAYLVVSGKENQNPEKTNLSSWEVHFNDIDPEKKTDKMKESMGGKQKTTEPMESPREFIRRKQHESNKKIRTSREGDMWFIDLDEDEKLKIANTVEQLELTSEEYETIVNKPRINFNKAADSLSHDTPSMQDSSDFIKDHNCRNTTMSSSLKGLHDVNDSTSNFVIPRHEEAENTSQTQRILHTTTIVDEVSPSHHSQPYTESDERLKSCNEKTSEVLSEPALVETAQPNVDVRGADGHLQTTFMNREDEEVADQTTIQSPKMNNYVYEQHHDDLNVLLSQNCTSITVNDKMQNDQITMSEVSVVPKVETTSNCSNDARNAIADIPTTTQSLNLSPTDHASSSTPEKSAFRFTFGNEFIESPDLTPEQERKRERFLKNRLKRQEAEIEKKRKKDERQAELKLKKEAAEKRKKDKEIEEQLAVATSQLHQETYSKRIHELTYNTMLYPIQEKKRTVDVRVETSPTVRQRLDFADEISTTPLFGEYKGPAVYQKPSGKSNKKIIQNAIMHCCLSGEVNKEAKKKCIEAIFQSEATHFLVLFREGLKFRSVYEYHPEIDLVSRIYGIGPKNIGTKMISRFLKYNSGAKEFNSLDTKHLSIQIDGLMIKKELWEKKQHLPSKTNSNLRKKTSAGVSHLPNR